jgi:hypothetical protein
MSLEGQCAIALPTVNEYGNRGKRPTRPHRGADLSDASVVSPLAPFGVTRAAKTPVLNESYGLLRKSNAPGNFVTSSAAAATDWGRSLCRLISATVQVTDPNGYRVEIQLSENAGLDVDFHLEVTH